MSKSDDVRFTRDGDQFHYLWAARRCLGLLSQTTTLVAVTIEGPANAEMPGQPSASEGEEVIDVAEYHGSISLLDATALRYIQLKHSTVNSAEEWTMSGLKVTLEGFAKRFQKLRENPDARALMHELTFVFASNRPISRDVYNAIEDARNQTEPRDITASKGLKKYTGLKGDDLAAFCNRLKLEAEHDGFLAQRRALDKELRGYLPGTDSEAFLQIKELVTRKATSEFATNSTITRLDILRVLGCDDDDLFPANNLITPPNNLVQRDSTPSIVQAIIDAGQLPVIVHAEGGMGKSVFATQLGSFLPEGSLAIVYDCFGNGQYRSPSYPRHGVRQALVQIANELSSRSLCPPLIPSGRANEAELFDGLAREFIRLCLAQSLSTAGPELRSWLNLYQGIGQSVSPDIQIVYKLLEDISDDEPKVLADNDDPNMTKVIFQLDEIIEKLGHFRQSLSQKMDVSSGLSL